MATTLVLTRGEVAALLDLDTCIAAVERAFLLHAQGYSLGPGVLGVAATGGGFHIKAAGLRAAGADDADDADDDAARRTYFATKINGNFAGNAARGLSRIQGVIVLCDGDDGTPLAIMDSIEITRLRTGAATAVAARHLAPRDARVATVCGCGVQGRVQLEALTRVAALEEVYAYDLDPDAAERFASQMGLALGLRIRATADLQDAVGRSQICVTATPSREWFLPRSWVAPGTFIAAVGADNEDKRELEPALLAAGTIVVDILAQCREIGELHHAVAEGAIAAASAHTELAEIVAGRHPGRTDPDEILIFDSTGTALQDVAAAAAVYERALRADVGTRLPM